MAILPETDEGMKVMKKRMYDAQRRIKKFGWRFGGLRVRRASDLTVLAPNGVSKNKKDPDP